MRANQFVTERFLGELAMGPSSLRRMAATINAKVGMEFEMYVPNAAVDDSGGEYEPDFSMDERAYSLENIADFFLGGEGTNSRRDVERLKETLDEKWVEAYSDALETAWMSEGKDALRDYIVNNDLWDENDAITIAIEEMGLSDEEKSEAEKIGAILDARKYNRIKGEINRDSDAMTNWKAAKDEADAKLEEMVEEEWDAEGRTYDDAKSEFTDEWNDLEFSEWLSEAGLDTMEDIYNHRDIDIQWPHYSFSGGGGGGRDVHEIAKEFEEMIGRPVASSDSYHGVKRNGVSYIVEPDSSLDEPDSSDDGGLEFVSPPLPLPEMLADLKKVKAWADEQGCYSNSSTGLHINVSVDGMAEDSLDYVKLAILLGDQYVLDQFGRAANTYCKSGMEQVKLYARQKPDSVQFMLDKMRQGLNDIASKAIHSGVTNKYTSINNKEGYVEFRSPGDDWLGDYYEKIEPTLLRMVVALDAACDPQKARQEYLKKLYLLLAPSSTGDDTIKYFAQYSAGELPAAALRSFIKQIQLQRSATKKTNPTEKYWYKVTITGHASSIEVVAFSPEEAKINARKEWGIRDIDAPDNLMQAVPIRKYVAPQLPSQPQADASQQGRWARWYITTISGDKVAVSARSYAEAKTAAYTSFNLTDDQINSIVLDSSDPAAPTQQPTGNITWIIFDRTTDKQVLSPFQAPAGNSNNGAMDAAKAMIAELPAKARSLINLGALGVRPLGQ